MSGGGVLQLIANDIGDPNSILYNNNSMDIITHKYREPIIFNSTNSFIIVRSCDIIKSIFFTFKMAPLPPGWIYKNKWINYAFESIELSIGGYSILKYNKYKERILKLIFPENNSVNGRHLNFDYTLEERRAKSLQTHEIMFEFNIKDIFSDGIPLISLAFSSVEVNFTLGSIENCVEYEGIDEDFNLFLILMRDYIIESKAQSLGIFLQADPRNIVAELNHQFNTIQYTLASIIINSNETCFNIGQLGRCSSAYIHITNEDGSEIPSQVLDSLRVVMSSIDRFNISGFQSRYHMPQILPYQTRDNSISQNLYYISYHSPTYGPQYSTDSVENVLNHNRIDNEKIIFTYANSVSLPLRIKINIMHRVKNVLRIADGVCDGYRYNYNESSIRIGTMPIPRQIIENGVEPITSIETVALPRPVSNNEPVYVFNTNSFIPSNTIINIQLNDNICVITLEPIEDNIDVVQCQKCRKICIMEAINEWFKTSKTCPHCRTESRGIIDFKCGKANLFSIISNILLI